MLARADLTGSALLGPGQSRDWLARQDHDFAAPDLRAGAPGVDEARLDRLTRLQQVPDLDGVLVDERAGGVVIPRAEYQRPIPDGGRLVAHDNRPHGHTMHDLESSVRHLQIGERGVARI